MANRDDSRNNQALSKTGKDGKSWKSKKTSRQMRARARARATRPQKPFPFLKLPAEIRNLIYKESFDQNNGLYWIGETVLKLGRKQAALNGLSPRAREPENKDRKTRSISVALLRSNRMIHTEASGILYGHPFTFSSVAAMELFLIRLTPATISHIQHVELAPPKRRAGGSRSLPAALALLSPAVNLRFLRVPSVATFPRPHDDRSRAFHRTLGPSPWDGNMTVGDWDILVGRNMAREAYAQMFPFLASFLRSPEPSEEEAGGRVAKLLGVLRIFEEGLENGPRPRPGLQHWEPGLGYHKEDCVRFGPGCAAVPRAAIAAAAWTPARREAMWKAMGEEIARLVDVD